MFSGKSMIRVENLVVAYHCRVASLYGGGYSVAYIALNYCNLSERSGSAAITPHLP